MDWERTSICNSSSGVKMEVAISVCNVLHVDNGNIFVWWRRTTIYLFSILGYEMLY